MAEDQGKTGGDEKQERPPCNGTNCMATSLLKILANYESWKPDQGAAGQGAPKTGGNSNEQE